MTDNIEDEHKQQKQDSEHKDEQRIRQNGLRQRKRPLMLFIHGFPEFWYSWRYQITHFSSQYNCVAMDLRGYV